jgi:hypothetical protein
MTKRESRLILRHLELHPAPRRTSVALVAVASFVIGFCLALMIS